MRLARSWAAEGVPCLRVDLSGIGDSPTRPGRTELVEYPADAVADLGDIRRAVSTEGVEPVFVGLCSGAYHAVEAALAGPTRSVCLINPVLSTPARGSTPTGVRAQRGRARLRRPGRLGCDPSLGAARHDPAGAPAQRGRAAPPKQPVVRKRLLMTSTPAAAPEEACSRPGSTSWW